MIKDDEVDLRVPPPRRSSNRRRLVRLPHPLFFFPFLSLLRPAFSSVPKILEQSVDLMDAAVGLASLLGREGSLSSVEEASLVSLALRRDPGLLILAKHYREDARKFLVHAAARLDATPSDSGFDAIVVGGGLAGLAATLEVLDRNGRVVLVDKERNLGGNSARASSGINGCCPHGDTYGDSFANFAEDTVRSAGPGANAGLIDTLVRNSGEAVRWLVERAGVDLSRVAQLGGHSYKRTNRPDNGMAGAEIIYGMGRAVKEIAKKEGRVQILSGHKAEKLIYEHGKVVGVEVLRLKDDVRISLQAPRTVLATGGFASDRSQGSYLDRHRPELMNMAATAGTFSTGDGIEMATAIGAGLVDMDKVQIHPTGWVNPTDPNNTEKVLAAELMRGVGGVLINHRGERFCNELGTRAYVTDKMLGHNPTYVRTSKWDPSAVVPTFSLVLSSSAAADGRKHVDLYVHKGLLFELHGIAALADFLGVPTTRARDTLRQYREDAAAGRDRWDKTSFRGVPSADLDHEIFYAGTVTPVLHYCMGGVTIDPEGRVLGGDGEAIPGLLAAGEVSGGVHGHNRLGGNSLLECTVYGRIVGQGIPVANRTRAEVPSTVVAAPVAKAPNSETPEPAGGSDRERPVTLEEVALHNTEEDCWVAIHGKVYDLTDFAPEHPPGTRSITNLGGTDGTAAFHAVHNRGLLDDFDDVQVGVLAS